MGMLLSRRRTNPLGNRLRDCYSYMRVLPSHWIHPVHCMRITCCLKIFYLHLSGPVVYSRGDIVGNHVLDSELEALRWDKSVRIIRQLHPEIDL